MLLSAKEKPTNEPMGEASLSSAYKETLLILSMKNIYYVYVYVYVYVCKSQSD